MAWNDWMMGISPEHCLKEWRVEIENGSKRLDNCKFKEADDFVLVQKE